MNIYGCFVVLLLFSGCFAYCTDQQPSKSSSILMREFCEQNNGTHYDRKCSQNSTLIGIDLSNCSLVKINLSETDLVTLKWLAINDNHLILNHTINELRTATNLSTILIDLDDNCVNFDVNFTTHDLLECTQPTHACKKDPCPDNTNCSFDGPGLFQCPCLEEWQSYKCLKKGGFPYVSWLVSISAGTIALCIVIRLLQKNDRKKGEEYRQLQDTRRQAMFQNNDGMFG